jgi:hypothetical protein
MIRMGESKRIHLQTYHVIFLPLLLQNQIVENLTAADWAKHLAIGRGGQRDWVRIAASGRGSQRDCQWVRIAGMGGQRDWVQHFAVRRGG